MITLQMKDLDMEKISRSGQCFRLNREEDTEEGDAGKSGTDKSGTDKSGVKKKNTVAAGMDESRGGRRMYSLIAWGEYLKIEQEGERVRFFCTEEDWAGRWRDYFDCDTDYGRICASVDPKDRYMSEAARFGSGIRILRQELFETVICFIISQQNHIPRIKSCVEKLCRVCGERKEHPYGGEYYAFPAPERLAALTEAELSEVHLGYRDRYILKTARMIASGEVDLNRLPHMEYGEAREELMKLCGVGVKVAECVCLFSLHHTDAFPVDTHIRSVLLKHYPEGFPLSRYPGCAGILQQYAFYYDLYGE